MRQDFSPRRPPVGRLFSRLSKIYRDLGVNILLLISSCSLAYRDGLLPNLHHAFDRLAEQLETGKLGHLPGFLFLAAIAGTVLLVQEVEKRRRLRKS